MGAQTTAERQHRNQVNIALMDGEVEALDEASADEEMSRSAFMRRALRHELERLAARRDRCG